MEFGALPPEVNSARMYAGPGSAPMLAAAAAWDGLAGELSSAAEGYDTVVSGLAGEEWLGPSSASMAAAVAPYTAWMSAAAAQAQQTADQARAAAAAYQAAFAATVPPPVIAANRSELASLLATNLLGHNTAAIAAAEAQYGEMWAQDAAAMHGYALSAAAASTVTPFTAPPATTNPAGPGVQAASVAHATGSATASNVQSTLAKLVTAMPQTLQSLAAPVSNPVSGAAHTLQSITSTPLVSSLSTAAGVAEYGAKSILPFNDAMISVIMGLVLNTRGLQVRAETAAEAALSAEASAVGAASAGTVSLDGAGSAVSAGMGNAGVVGEMAVPPTWATAAPAIKMAAAALPGTGLGAVPAVAAGVPGGGVFADAAVASLAGRAFSGGASRSRPASIMNGHTPGRLERLVAEVAGDQPVQHWHADPSRLDGLLAELSLKPGVHAVHLNHDGQTKPPPRTQSS